MYAATKYGMSAAQPLHPDESHAANGAVTGRNANIGSINPENPMVWLLGIVGLTLGLVAVNGRIRVGPVSAGVAAGHQ